MKKLILVIALLMCSQLAMAFSYTLEISADELQSKVSAMMPMEKKKSFITVILSHPEIDLTVGNNKIGVSSQIAIVALGGISGSGKVKITGLLSYDSEKSAFFFKNPEVVSLESEDVPPLLLPKVKALTQLAVSQFLSKKPIYKLKDDNVKQKLTKAVLQSIQVENNQLLAELSLF